MSYKGPERRKHRDCWYLTPREEKVLLTIAGILFLLCIGAGLHALSLARSIP